jgi:hypothetical protein
MRSKFQGINGENISKMLFTARNRHIKIVVTVKRQLIVDNHRRATWF